MIKIFTDEAYLTESHRRFVFPLLFHIWYKKDAPLQNLYPLVNDPGEADVHVLPVSAEHYISSRSTDMDSFIRRALSLGKHVWVYSSGDLGISFGTQVTVFRFGGFASKMPPTTVILPAHTVDPYPLLGKDFVPLEKADAPQIAFTGNADAGVRKWITEYYIQLFYAWHRFTKRLPSDRQPFFPSGIVRYRLLKGLQQDKRISTDFIFRKTYRAGARTEAERRITQLEFYHNMQASPYTFCMRGNGNFSVRFYEALAMGRIPVLVDTDVRLPLEDMIRWERHCVKVTADTLSDDLLDFHQRISPEAFRSMQEENRRLWQDALSDVRFFHSVHADFQKKRNQTDRS